MFKKVLVANRGEIALRVIRACRELGVTSAAVYVSSDREGLWVREADEAYELSGFSDRDGYLNAEALVALARKARADAVHPGYGFLSEQASFARACRESGLSFIGPTPEAMEKAGNKVEARRLAQESGIPVLPGTAPLDDVEEAVRQALRLGFPILLKAAAGGGGRGIRLVEDASRFREAFRAASREAEGSFGDGRVFLEKFLPRPRHIEVQVLADHHGNAVHLGERECSIQRRFQKLVEEAPSPAVDEKLRQALGEKALAFARASGYTNAGTVEFLLDHEGRFYFLEVNARIQVEHPVTECVTGIDLIEAQIRIAAGEKIPVRQEEIKLQGWAIEARINGEDPKEFRPSPGAVTWLELPGGPGIRVDTALVPGARVSEAFDSLLAKLVAFGPNRQIAIRRMLRALREFHVGGVATTLPFHLRLFGHPAFQTGDLSTRFVEEHLEPFDSQASPEELALAAVLSALEERLQTRGIAKANGANPWSRAGRLENVTGFR